MESKIVARFGGLRMEAFDFAKVENDGKMDGKCSFGGYCGLFLNDLIVNRWIKLGHNCTIDAWKYFGRFEEGDEESQGLKTAMVNKKIDVALVPTPIWEHRGKYEHIYYTHPLMEEYLGMMCAYNYTEAIESADLVDAYLDFPSSYYLSLIGTLVTFILAWNICSYVACKMSPVVKKEVTNSKMPAYWIMICAVLDQDQYPKISKISFAILSFCFSLFFFITVDSFLLNAMSSSLVSIKEPAVLRTYQDILDRPMNKLRVMFSPGMGEENFFRGAKPGSKEAQIWDRHHDLTEMTMETVSDLWQPIIGQEVIGITRIWVLRAAANFGLTKTRQIGNKAIRALATRDETGKSFTNAIMYSTGIHPILEEHIKERVYRLSQSGILEWFITEQIPRTFGDSSDIYLDTLISTKLFLPAPPLPTIKFDNTSKLIVLYFSSLAVCIIVLFFEILKESIWKEIVELGAKGSKLVTGLKPISRKRIIQTKLGNRRVVM